MEKINTQKIFDSLKTELSNINTKNDLETIEKKYLGKKSEIKLAFSNLKQMKEDEKKAYAAELNSFMENVQNTLEKAKNELGKEFLNRELQKEWVDMTLPGVCVKRGAIHPLTQVENHCLEIAKKLGFSTAIGPEVDKAFYNFDALNIPEHHPAREMQDTFWLEKGLLLRSHTTTIQAHTLEQHPEFPIKIIASGRVYRNEAIDATHTAMFHQFEGFWVDKGVNFAHLKGVLTFFAKELYGQDCKVRIKPKYYPYTEPSIGMDIECSSCKGEGCIACHGAGWVTVIGAGMIHKDVLERFGYDSKEISGFAFGWGMSRLTTQLFNIKRTKALYEQDLRFFKSLHRN